MQLLSAFSRPQTVPAVPATLPRKSLWILDSWRDLILYVGTPLLIVPMFALAQSRWSAENIYLFVAAFGAMGHHLPGMIRAYGDRALFERFKWRFTFAPIFLVAVCTTFFWWDLKGIVLVVFIWGVWHGMMQTYGFCRIYDAKMGSFAALTRRLDFATCGIWFATAVLLSSQRMTDTLDTYYSAGGPFIPSSALRLGQQVMLAAAFTVSALFLANFIWMWISGRRPNPVKLALLVTSICFWWYCNNIVASILVGIALFEVFHDVQYLSLVWIYNRNRVEKDSSIGGFMRFVFRRSGSLVGLYIGLIFAYGSLGYFNSHLGIDTIKRILTGVVTASALLHFYYDGFIWKVREKSTRQSLGLAGGTADVSTNGFLPSWALHGAKWVAVFVIPLGALWLGEWRAPRGELQRSAQVVADLPVGARQHYNYGTALQKAGRLDEAAEQFYTALRFDPVYTKAHINLAKVLMDESKLDEAQIHYEAALRIEPNSADFHSAYAYLLERLGRVPEAAAEYETAALLKPKDARMQYGYGVFLEKKGKLDEAIAQYRFALQADPELADAQSDLASALFVKGELQEAKVHYLEAARLQPKSADVHSNLGNVFLREGNVSQAIIQYEEALRLDPKLKAAEENLRLARASDTRFQPRSPK
jgi:tetratricopeptide (TPR) repeat protein/branched-subunit amino acid transport protein